MKYAVIDGNKVVNLAEASPEFAAEQGWVEAQNAKIGDLYENGVFTTPPPDADLEAAAIRARRNALLLSSDWTQVADAPVDQVAWTTYRQALRDVPSQAGFPWDIQWPIEP